MSQAQARRLGVRGIRNHLENDLVRTVQARSKETPRLTEPLARWEWSGVPTPNFGKLESLNDKRWEKAELRAVPMLVATRRCGQMFGTIRYGNLARPLQA